MKLIKIFFIVCIAFNFSGCKSVKRDQPMSPKSIAIVVDTLSVHDIDGTIDGIYNNENEIISSAILVDAEKLLKAKTSVVSKSYSVGAILSEQDNLMYAKNDKSTGNKFQKKLPQNSDSNFYSQGFIDLYKEIMDEGKTAFKEQHLLSIPSLPANSAVTHLLFIQNYNRQVSTIKSLSIGISVGLLSGGFINNKPLTGGMCRVALINLNTRKVEWYMERELKGYKDIQVRSGKIVKVLTEEVSNTQSNSDQNSKINPPINSIFNAKLALRNNIISKGQYQIVLEELKSKYKSTIEMLDERYENNEISKPVMVALSMIALNDYKGL